MAMEIKSMHVIAILGVMEAKEIMTEIYISAVRDG